MARVLSLVAAACACGVAAAHRGGLAVAALDHTIARSALQEQAAATVDTLEDNEQNPVKRVVLLLGKMKQELEAEAENESAMYDKMVCWCDTNEKEKKKAVADAESKDLELSSEIEGRSASFGEQATGIAELKEQIGEDTSALEKATAIREKEASAFSAEEKDLVQAVANLKNAVAVLAKHNGGSLLQAQAPVATGLRVLLRDLALKYELMMAGEASRSRRPRASSGLLQTALRAGSEAKRRGEQSLHEELLSVLNIHGDSPASLPLPLAQRLVAESAHSAGSFVQAGSQQPQDAAYKSYSSRSGPIFGIMNEMLEEFESQLSTLQKEEVTAIQAYQALSKAKKEQISVAKEKLDDLEAEHAANQKALSDAKEDLDLTRKQRSADVEFLQNLKVTCKDLDKEWERRSATRSEELKAVSEAIVILTEDDNREHLAKTVALLQDAANHENSAMAARRARAAELLRHAAHSPDFEADDLLAAWHGRQGARMALGAAAGPRAQLSVLAMTTQLDSFEKVKEMMDKMVAELKDQQKEEVEFKAYCNKELDANDKATYSKTQHKGDLESKLDSLATLVDKLAKEVADAKTQISDTETEIKKASEAREAENKEFQTTVADQRATQAILQKALARLQDFYSKGIGKKVIYLQRSVQTPPVKFNKYKANDGASPVVGLLEQIISDSKALESEATAAETKAQAQYEQFVKDSNGIIAELSEAVTAKTKATADAKLDASEAAADLQSTVAELDSLAAYQGDLHSQCDFVLKNFEIRQRARLQEMESIQAAKAILSGAKGSQ